ncbi:hypothetical protein ED733_006056 [Metarhizium rileyi]|nr:hypothetical protein ED733_006056 [Metarhizium rileyi]
MSFHIPRRPPVDISLYATQKENFPQIPAKSRLRARAYTAPEVDAIKERVASALIEVEILQKYIDNVIERQSIYVNSRPITPLSMAYNITELEPMPSIPALPPAAPSFAERLNADIERPRTAPVKTSVTPTPNRLKMPMGDGKIILGQNLVAQESQPLSPPLPLVLRPPLRKKKSFSRVSTWLFPGQDQSITRDFDSVTNKPKPIKNNQGFYQIVSADGTLRGGSCESVNSISTWQIEDEGRTTPSMSSPESTPTSKQEEQPRLERSGTFGKNDGGIRTPPVGIAM